METAHTHTNDQLLDESSESSSEDAESLASLETNDGSSHAPEKILAQWRSANGFIWYLVKWQDCPLLNSSWESSTIFDSHPYLSEPWLLEKTRQAEGKSKPLDIVAFNQAVLDLEAAERKRRSLRRLMRKFERVLLDIESSQYEMARSPTKVLVTMFCLALPVFSQAASNEPPSQYPATDTNIVCSTGNPVDCYPRIFRPTEDFQPIREGQDIPPGLHVRMNIYTGAKEARINKPMEGDEVGVTEAVPVEQAVLIVDQFEPAHSPEAIDIRNPLAYNAAGKISPPVLSGESAEEFGAFQKAMLVVKMEARGFDKGLDDLLELASDLYYGVEIAKDGPVLEKLVCLTLGKGSERIPPEENHRGQKAAAILATALQNNPTALAELSRSGGLVVYPTCLADPLQVESTGVTANKNNFVKALRQRLGREKDPATLKAKVTAISGLLRDVSIREHFMQSSCMELLLAIFLKKGEQFDIVRQKVGQLVMDIFLDESIGAAVGVWPTMPVSESRTCQSKGRILNDGCWEYHIEEFLKRSPEAGWAQEFLTALRSQRAKVRSHRAKFASSTENREL